MARRNEDFALALVDGAFTKALEIQLVRKVCPPARAEAAHRCAHCRALNLLHADGDGFSILAV